jgi:hypothetical protein
MFVDETMFIVGVFFALVAVFEEALWTNFINDDCGRLTFEDP